MDSDVPSQASGLLSRKDLWDLLSHRGGPHVSIYIPTERAGPQTRENPIRFKNLVTRAVEELIWGGMRPTEARELLAPARSLEGDYEFWQRQSDGLATFVAPGFFSQRSLPLRFEEIMTVGERFHVRPLLELFAEDAYFYLLAISLGDVRVFRCSRYGEQELAIEGMPKSLDDALWPDDPEKQQQFRRTYTAQSGGTFLTSDSETYQQEMKEHARQYFRIVDRAMQKLLRGESAPLVLASVEYLQPIYAEANTYAHLWPEGVRGNPEGAPPDELRAKAWELVAPGLAAQHRQAVSRFQSLQGTGLTSTQIEEIAREAARGRVDTLLYRRDGEAWGRITDGAEAVEIHGGRRMGDEDAVDFAAVQTLLNGGKVHVLDAGEMPADAVAVAIYRY
jgi:hypothetical protein